MPDQKTLRNYARLAIETGVNVQKGQLLVISCPVTHSDFAHLCMEEAYRCGAGEVWMNWADEDAERINLLYGEEAFLAKIPDYQLARVKEAQERKAAFLHIISPVPGIMAGVDEAKAGRISKSRRKAMAPYQAYSMASKGQWSILALPNPRWAVQVFPEEKDPEIAEQKLWNAILNTVYVNAEDDPVATWKAHSREIRHHCDLLDQKHFKAIHFHNSLGTDLTVGLAEEHLWGGGEEKASEIGCLFNPNLPTEEVFTTPDRMHVDGTVYASRPLLYEGHRIENFSVTFEHGKAVSCHAEKGEETLKQILSSDENSDRLGEVALISYDTPISEMKILFLNTLFDENASCHLAFGASYPGQIENGTKMSEEELKEHGGNVSEIHVDFMFGTADLTADGIYEDGTSEPVFRDGRFVF